MNTEYTSPAQGKSFIPLTLVSLSVIFFFAWQLSQVSKARENLNTNKKQVEEFMQVNIPKYDTEVNKAEQVVVALKKIAGDVLELSKTDPNAKQVVDNLEKAGIKFQANPNASPAPAPAPVTSGTSGL